MLFAKRSNEYQTWLESNGVTISPKISIHDFRSTNQGRGIIAVEDIGPDEEIFRIPRTSDVVLNANAASLFKEYPDLRDVLEAIGPWETLIVCILYEFKKGKDSAWSPYFEALPFYAPKFHSNQLLYWNDSEIDALRPSLVVHRIGKEQAKAMYRTIKKTLHEYGFTEFKEFSLDDLYLVALLILSYSFDIIPAIEAVVDLKTSTDDDTDNFSEPSSETDQEYGSNSLNSMNGSNGSSGLSIPSGSNGSSGSSKANHSNHSNGSNGSNGSASASASSGPNSSSSASASSGPNCATASSSASGSDASSSASASSGDASSAASAASASSDSNGSISSSSIGLSSSSSASSSTGSSNSNSAIGSDGTDSSEYELDSGGLLPSSATVKSMIPLADTLNANTTLHNACLIYGPTALIMRSVQPIKKGEQVYNTYLEHPNSEILRRYGYVEEKGSKFDFGEVTLHNIRAILNKPLIEMALEVARNSDLVEDEVIVVVEDTYDCYNTGEVLPEFTVLLQYLTAVDNLPEEETRELDEDSLSRILRKTLQLIESGKLTINFKINYAKVLAHRIAEYGPVEFSPSDTERERMAKIVLQSELRSLKACSNTLEVYKNYKFVDDHKFLRAVFKKRPVQVIRHGLKRSKI